MLCDVGIHVLLVCTIVQLFSVEFEVGIETLFDTVEQQYEDSIATNKDGYCSKEAKQLLVFTYKFLGQHKGTDYIGDDNQPQELCTYIPMYSL